MGKTLPQKERKIQKRIGERRRPKEGNHPPQRGEEGDKVVPPPKSSMPSSEKCSDEEADPRPLNDVPPLWKKQQQGYK